jgi:class 3 adenylate cyclase
MGDLMLNPRTIHELHSVSCVALIVDINGSEKLIDAGQDGLTGQFFRDVLEGGIHAVEKCNGSVISFTGDGFVAVLPTEIDAAQACWEIARDFRKSMEYLEACRKDNPYAWPLLDVGLGLKIAIERGHLEVSSISSTFLGVQPYLVGPPTVYASRISAFGNGNRCVIGPQAAANWPYAGLEGPFEGHVKHKGLNYKYYFYDLDDLWID